MPMNGRVVCCCLLEDPSHPSRATEEIPAKQKGRRMNLKTLHVAGMQETCLELEEVERNGRRLMQDAGLLGWYVHRQLPSSW